MSIYTDMIAFIEKNGIGTKDISATPGNPHCMFGVKARVLDLSFSAFDGADLYATNDIPELVDLVKKYMPSQLVLEYELDFTEDDWDDYRWIYNYNDSIINGDSTHAIRLLEEAEKLRIKNVNLH